jgi:uncharacterized glyoxalase superfamily protein PhnB
MNAGFSPCFPVSDMRVTLAHYEQLGFAVMPYAEATERDHDPARTAAAADLSVADCDALARQWSATGVPGTSDAYDTPYGMREAVHVDPDNNLIRFGSPLNRN